MVREKSKISRGKNIKENNKQGKIEGYMVRGTTG
jgi:hypothetical protein